MNKSYSPDYLRDKLRDIFASHGVKLAYFFGSQVDGTVGDMSDVDIAVLWPEEEKMPLKASLILQDKAREKLSEDRIEMGPLNGQALSFCYNVIKTGISIWGDEETRVEYETSILDEYLDFAYLAEEYNRLFSVEPVRK